MTDQRTEAKQFAHEVVRMIMDSDMHQFLAWAELIDAIAAIFDGVILDDDVAHMRTFASGIRETAITDDMVQSAAGADWIAAIRARAKAN